MLATELIHELDSTTVAFGDGAFVRVPGTPQLVESAGVHALAFILEPGVYVKLEQVDLDGGPSQPQRFGRKLVVLRFSSPVEVTEVTE